MSDRCSAGRRHKARTERDVEAVVKRPVEMELLFEQQLSHFEIALIPPGIIVGHPVLELAQHRAVHALEILLELVAHELGRHERVPVPLTPADVHEKSGDCGACRVEKHNNRHHEVAELEAVDVARRGGQAALLAHDERKADEPEDHELAVHLVHHLQRGFAPRRLRPARLLAHSRSQRQEKRGGRRTFSSMTFVRNSNDMANASIPTIIGAAHPTSMWPLKMWPPPMAACAGSSVPTRASFAPAARGRPARAQPRPR